MAREILIGGRGDYRPDSDFDPRELAIGIREEMEHTDNLAVAREIAKDHLSQDKLYYRKLKRIEKGGGLWLVVTPKALRKAGGPYIGPRGGKWADPQHTQHWEQQTLRLTVTPKGVEEVKRHAAAAPATETGPSSQPPRAATPAAPKGRKMRKTPVPPPGVLASDYPHTPPSGALPQAASDTPLVPSFHGHSWSTIGQKIENRRDAVAVFADLIDRDREHFAVLSLDEHDRPLNVHVAHIGTLSEVVVSPVQVFKPALMFGAAKVFVAHNHPSGSVIASKADRDLTEQLRRVAGKIGIGWGGSFVVGRRPNGAKAYYSIDHDQDRDLPDMKQEGSVPEVDFRLDPQRGSPGPQVQGPQDAIAALQQARAAGSGVLFLNARNQVVATHVGDAGYADMLRKAAAFGANRIITAGSEDQAWTKDQVGALGLTLLDHVAFKEGEEPYTLADRQLLKARRDTVMTLTFRGLAVRIENQQGTARQWYNAHTGTHGETIMQVPYGYVPRTEGTDGDELDVFVGPDESASYVFLINQLKAPDFRTLDEQKAMIGFGTEAEARACYLAHYDNPRFLGSVITMPWDTFVRRIREGGVDGKQLRKATAVQSFGGVLGAIVSPRCLAIGVMGMQGDPARRPAGAWTVKVTDEHPGSPAARAKRSKGRKRRKSIDQRERLDSAATAMLPAHGNSRPLADISFAQRDTDRQAGPHMKAALQQQTSRTLRHVLNREKLR